MDENNTKDILIKTKPGTIERKTRGKVAEEEYCWWHLHKLPNPCVIGGKVLFCDGKKIFAEGEIIDLDTNRSNIIFTPLIIVDKPQSKRATFRGFTYA